jgi:hypothetical protein
MGFSHLKQTFCWGDLWDMWGVLGEPRCPFPHTIQMVFPFNFVEVVVNDFFCSALVPGFESSTTAFIRGTHQPPSIAQLNFKPGDCEIRDQALPPGESAASFLIKVPAPKGNAFNLTTDPRDEVMWRDPKAGGGPPRCRFRLLPQAKAAQELKEVERPKANTLSMLNYFAHVPKPKPAAQDQGQASPAQVPGHGAAIVLDGDHDPSRELFPGEDS